MLEEISDFLFGRFGEFVCNFPLDTYIDVPDHVLAVN